MGPHKSPVLVLWCLEAAAQYMLAGPWVSSCQARVGALDDCGGWVEENLCPPATGPSVALTPASPFPTHQAPAGVPGAWEAAELGRWCLAGAACLTPWQGGRPWLQPTRVSACLAWWGLQSLPGGLGGKGRCCMWGLHSLCVCVCVCVRCNSRKTDRYSRALTMGDSLNLSNYQ